jgi:hypothetical protein
VPTSLRRSATLAEFDFRYNARNLSDSERTVAALMSTEGKRLRFAD